MSIIKELPIGMGGAIQQAFRRMGIAEESVAECKLSKQQGSDVFRNACPSEFISGFSDDVYRAHVDELCVRARAGGSLTEATSAEICGVLSHWSLQAPLGRAATALYERHFARVFGKNVEKPIELGGYELKEELPALERKAKKQAERARPKP